MDITERHIRNWLESVLGAYYDQVPPGTPDETLRRSITLAPVTDGCTCCITLAAIDTAVSTEIARYSITVAAREIDPPGSTPESPPAGAREDKEGWLNGTWGPVKVARGLSYARTVTRGDSVWNEIDDSVYTVLIPITPKNRENVTVAKNATGEVFTFPVAWDTAVTYRRGVEGTAAHVVIDTFPDTEPV